MKFFILSDVSILTQDMDRLTGKINQLFHTMADFTNNMKEYMRGVVEKKKAAKAQKERTQK